jgi:hypothetical protein
MFLFSLERLGTCQTTIITSTWKSLRLVSLIPDYCYSSLPRQNISFFLCFAEILNLIGDPVANERNKAYVKAEFIRIVPIEYLDIGLKKNMLIQVYLYFHATAPDNLAELISQFKEILQQQSDAESNSMPVETDDMSTNSMSTNGESVETDERSTNSMSTNGEDDSSDMDISSEPAQKSHKP